MKKQPEIHYILETISPQRARELLEMNVFNRPLNRSHVQFLVRCLRNGEWKVNGDPVRISPGKVLLDGQHRLTAVIESGITIQSFVAYNVPQDVFDTIDSGIKVRGGAEVLALNGEKNYALLSGTVRTYHIYTNRIWNSFVEQKMSNQEIERALAETPQIRDSVNFIVKNRRGLKILAPIRLFAAAHAIFTEIDREAADDFIIRLATGAEMKKGDPLLSLRSRLFENRCSVKRFSSHHALALIIKAWNTCRRNGSVKSISYNPNRECFPEPK